MEKEEWMSCFGILCDCSEYTFDIMFKKVRKMDVQFLLSEAGYKSRICLWMSFRTVINEKRNQIKFINLSKGDYEEGSIIADYCWKLRMEIDRLCTIMCEFLENIIEKIYEKPGSYIFLKYRADCLRYQSETGIQEEWFEDARISQEGYEEVQKEFLRNNYYTSDFLRTRWNLLCLYQNVFESTTYATKLIVNTLKNEDDLLRTKDENDESSAENFLKSLKAVLKKINEGGDVDDLESHKDFEIC